MIEQLETERDVKVAKAKMSSSEVTTSSARMRLSNGEARDDPLSITAPQHAPRIRFIEPQLPSLADQPPEGKHWIAPPYKGKNL
jgi:hypothetical protein